MPDIYQAFKDTVREHGMAEALRQVEESNDRIAAENRSFRAMFIGLFAVIAIAIFFGVFL